MADSATISSNVVQGTTVTSGVTSGSTVSSTVTTSSTNTATVVAGGIGPAGATGAAGSNGVDGADGADGVGVPVGGTTGQVLSKNSNTDYDTEWSTVSGTGDVVGPASATDNAITRYDSTTGKLLQGTGITIADNDYMLTPASIESAGAVIVDTISEHTAAAGVTIDGVLVKDGAIAKAVVGLGNVDNTADTAKPVSTAQQTALDLKVDENVAITGATKTKVTYDAKGLVTAGADATTADIADSSDKRYVTDAQLVVIGNTSGTNTGDQSLAGLQPIDSDLTAIAAISPSNDDVIQRKAGAWTNRTMAQVKTDLALAKGDVGLGNVDNTSNATERAATATLTNKRVTKRTGTATSSATPTPDADAHDVYTVTALAAGATFGAPTGTPTEGQSLVIRVKDNGTARSLAYNAIYRAVGVTLPTTTVISKTIYLGMFYNSSDTKWDVVAVAQEA